MQYFRLHFQYTDELTPFLEWLEESIAKSTREINSNSVEETEEIMTRHEKNLDQLDKKKKVYLEHKGKAEKLAQDPKAPKFMQVKINSVKMINFISQSFSGLEFYLFYFVGST